MELYKKNGAVLEGRETEKGIVVKHDDLSKVLDNLTEKNTEVNYSFICATENHAVVTCNIHERTTGRNITEIGESKGDAQCEYAFRLAFDKAAIRFLDINAISELQIHEPDVQKDFAVDNKTESSESNDSVIKDSKNKEDDIDRNKNETSGKIQVGDYRPVFGDFMEGGEDFGLSVSQFFKKAEESKNTATKLEKYLSLDPNKEADKAKKYGLIAVQRYLTKGYILNAGLFSKKCLTAQEAFDAGMKDEPLKAALQMYLSADIEQLKNERDKLCVLALQSQAEEDAHGKKK